MRCIVPPALRRLALDVVSLTVGAALFSLAFILLSLLIYGRVNW